MFETGALKIQQTKPAKTDYIVGLLVLGKRPYVHIHPALSHLGFLLTSQFPEHQQTAVNLLLQWLDDGRVTAWDVVQLLTERLIETNKGFQYLDKGLASLAVASPA